MFSNNLLIAEILQSVFFLFFFLLHTFPIYYFPSKLHLFIIYLKCSFTLIIVLNLFFLTCSHPYDFRFLIQECSKTTSLKALKTPRNAWLVNQLLKFCIWIKMYREISVLKTKATDLPFRVNYYSYKLFMAVLFEVVIS